MWLMFSLGFLIGVLSVGVYALRLKLQVNTKQASLRFVAPHQKQSNDEAFHIGITEEQSSKLLEIAQKCPVHRTLVSEMDIRTRVL